MEIGAGIFLSAVLLGTVWLYVATKDRWNWKKILLWPLAIVLGLSVIGAAGIYINDWVQDRPKKELGLWGIQLGASIADVKFAKGEPSRQMARTIKFEGRTIKVPDDATDAEIAGILDQSAPNGLSAVRPGSPERIAELTLEQARALALASARRKRAEQEGGPGSPDEAPPPRNLSDEDTQEDANTWAYLQGERVADDGIYFVRFKDGKVRYVMYNGPAHTAPSIQGISLYSSPERLAEKFGQPSYISRSKDELRQWHSFERFNVAFKLEKNGIVTLGVYDSSTGPLKFSDEAKAEAEREKVPLVDTPSEAVPP